MSLYCSAADLHDHGLPPGAIPNEARLAAEVDTTADTITLNDHGLDAGDTVKFRAGAGGTLPTPLLSATRYYALPVDESIFQVAASEGGPPINLTTAGSNVLVLAPLPTLKAIEWASRIIDDLVPAHAVPFLSPVPDLVRMTCAELAAAKLANRAGAGASASLTKMRDDAEKRLQRWAQGIPVRGGQDESAREPTNVAASLALPCDNPWRRHGGLA